MKWTSKLEIERDFDKLRAYQTRFIPSAVVEFICQKIINSAPEMVTEFLDKTMGVYVDRNTGRPYSLCSASVRHIFSKAAESSHLNYLAFRLAALNAKELEEVLKKREELLAIPPQKAKEKNMQPKTGARRILRKTF